MVPPLALHIHRHETACSGHAPGAGGGRAAVDLNVEGEAVKAAYEEMEGEMEGASGTDAAQ